MNTKILQVVAILIITFAALSWIRSDGQYDFDIRSIIPFTRGEKITLYDWGALVLIVFGLCGIGRLYRPAEDVDDSPEADIEDTEDYEVLDEPDDGPDSGENEP